MNISDLSLEHYLPYLPIPNGFVITSSGQLETGLAIDYEDRESNIPRIGITGAVNLRNLSVAMQPKGKVDVLPFITIPGLTVEPAVEDLLSGGIKVGGISLDTPEFHLERDSKGELLPVKMPANTKGTTDTSGTDNIRKEISPIPVEIVKTEIRNATLNIVDKSVSPAFATQIKNTGLTILDLRANEKLSLSYVVNAVSDAVEKISLEGNAVWMFLMPDPMSISKENLAWKAFCLRN